MICYADKTFCGFYKGCKKGKDCSSALTPEVRILADVWWGKAGAPISVYARKPECFVKLKEAK